MENKDRRCLVCDTILQKNEAQVVFRALPKVQLKGVLRYSCNNCSFGEVEIPDLELLTQKLIEFLVTRKRRLDGEEVSFLRKTLDFSQAEIANILGVRPETFCRWEKERSKMNETAERLLRVLAFGGVSIVNEFPESFHDVGERKKENIFPVLEVEYENGEWKVIN